MNHESQSMGVNVTDYDWRKTVDYFNHMLSLPTLSANERLDISACLRALTMPDICEHAGRYLLIHKGDIYPESFQTPQDMPDTAPGVVFRIPIILRDKG